jgi:hypothetical protein
MFLANAVVMVSDTFGRDHLGAYENPYIRTRGPEHMPELYDLTEDSREKENKENIWEPRAHQGKTLCEGTISFLAEQGTPEDLLAPRRKAVESFVPGR